MPPSSLASSSASATYSWRSPLGLAVQLGNTLRRVQGTQHKQEVRHKYMRLRWDGLQQCWDDRALLSTHMCTMKTANSAAASEAAAATAAAHYGC
jgi:hypothetical protein